MTPSLPTFSMASAMISPISLVAVGEMVPTWAISLPVLTPSCEMLLELGDDGLDGLVDAALDAPSGWRRRRRA
jgi:hypothetical protein